jgi:hypothetical protein
VSPASYRPASPTSSAYVRIRQHTSAYVSIRQHTSACVNMHQHASGYVSMHQHASAYVVPASQRPASPTPAPVSSISTKKRMRKGTRRWRPLDSPSSGDGRGCYVIRQHASAYVSMRQHTSGRGCEVLVWRCGVSQHTSAYVSIRQHTSGYVSIRQHASAYVIPARCWCGGAA